MATTSRTVQKGEPVKIYTHEPDYFERTPAEKQRFCMTCYHYQPVEEKGRTNIICDVDGHYIGYIQASEQWCRRWKHEDGERAD